MVNIAELKIGDKVHHIGYPGGPAENGLVKEVSPDSITHVRVVYKCAGDWKNFMQYTSALTKVDHLYPGWNHQETPSL